MSNWWILRIIELIVGTGLMLTWAGILHYHVSSQSQVTPFPGPRSIPKAAIEMTFPDLDDAAIALSATGVALGASASFAALILFDSPHKSQWIGIFCGIAIMVSAWYLFRIEGKDAIERLLDTDPTNDNIPERDLWAPVVSNLVLTCISVVLVHRNFLHANFFASLPRRPQWIINAVIMAGILLGQAYFSIMIYASYMFGLVLLGISPFIAGGAFITGRFWEYNIAARRKPTINLDEQDVLISPEEIPA